ncbi:hypothetical protein CEXT_33121 [Caerostris extrusa]|uniref:Uncharacterized protein n=1 Tax=Caerostris extrusa TaxID=172846 RepID=A0AAV4W7K9_CAEEX|nr:hypothetical protein CEXT_33121 [Caerostris extrusa]
MSQKQNVKSRDNTIPDKKDKEDNLMQRRSSLSAHSHHAHCTAHVLTTVAMATREDINESRILLIPLRHI